MNDQGQAIPTAIYEGELKIGGLVLRTAVLDNGMRIINSDDMNKFFESFNDDNFKFTDAEAVELARWCKGK